MACVLFNIVRYSFVLTFSLLLRLMDPWKEIARNEQQQFLEIFGCVDWDVYRPEERRLFHDKVGLVIFGPPPLTNYNKEQVAHIKKVTDVIIREDAHVFPGSTWMSIVVLFVKPPKGDYYCHPVFRVPKYSGNSNRQHSFVDCIGRVYNSWNDFMENNKLPESEICYPVNGVYRQDAFGQVELKFGHCKSSVLMEVADIANNLLAFGSFGVAATALAFPVAAPLVAAVSVGTAVGGVYGAARATQDLVDRKKHGQSVGLADGRSLGNWMSVITGFTGVGSTIKILRLSGTLSKPAKVGLAFSAAGTIRSSSTPHEMFRDIRGKAMLLRDVSSYVLLFCHTVADPMYVVNFQNSDERNNILHIKSKLHRSSPFAETLRYLDFAGLEDGKVRDILSTGIFDYPFKSPFACSVEMFHKIEDYVSDCINRILTVMHFEKIPIGMKDIINFFKKYDLTWAIVVCKRILPLINCPKGGVALFDIMAGLYIFLKNVIYTAESRKNISFPGLKFTACEFVEIAKICIDKNQGFDVKFMKVFELFRPMMYVLIGNVLAHEVRKRIRRPNTQNVNSVPDEEVFDAVSDLVGSRVDSSTAKITYNKSEIFVVITDTNIQVSVVQVVLENNCGSITARVVR